MLSTMGTVHLNIPQDKDWPPFRAAVTAWITAVYISLTFDREEVNNAFNTSNESW